MLRFSKFGPTCTNNRLCFFTIKGYVVFPSRAVLLQYIHRPYTPTRYIKGSIGLYCREHPFNVTIDTVVELRN